MMDIKSKIPRLKTSAQSNSLSSKTISRKLDDLIEPNTSKPAKIKKVASVKTVSSRRFCTSNKFKKSKNIRSKYVSYSNPKSNVQNPLPLIETQIFGQDDTEQRTVFQEMEKKLKELNHQKNTYTLKTEHESAQIAELDKEVAKVKFAVEELTRELQKQRANLLKEEDHQRTYEAELKLVNSELADLHKQEHIREIKLKDLKNALAKIRGQHGAKSVSLDNRSEELLKVLKTHETEVSNVQAQVNELNTKIGQAKNEKEEKERAYRSEIESLNRKLEYTQKQLAHVNIAKDETVKLYNFLCQEAKRIMEETGSISEINFDLMKDATGKVPLMSAHEMKTKCLAFKMCLEHAHDTLLLYAKEKTRLIQVMSIQNPEDLQTHLLRTNKFLENLRKETNQLKKNIKILNNDLRNKSTLIKTLEDGVNLSDDVDHVKIKYLRTTLLTKMKRACEMEQKILRLKYYSKINEQRISKNKYLISIRDNLLQNADKTIKQMDVLKGHFRIIIDQHYLMSLKFNKQVSKLKDVKDKLDKMRKKAKDYEKKVISMKVENMFNDENQDEWQDLTDEPIGETDEEKLRNVQEEESEYDINTSEESKVFV